MVISFGDLVASLVCHESQCSFYPLPTTEEMFGAGARYCGHPVAECLQAIKRLSTPSKGRQAW